MYKKCEHYNSKISKSVLEKELDNHYRCETDLVISLMSRKIQDGTIQTRHELGVANENLWGLNDWPEGEGFGTSDFFHYNKMIDEAVCEKIDAAGVKSINVYSVITCSSKEGVCATCYGRDLSRGKIVHIGEAIGMISAQSIGEPGTQLTMRTFHVGGTAQIKQESQIVSKNEGTLKIINTNLILPKRAVENTKDLLVKLTEMRIELADETKWKY